MVVAAFAARAWLQPIIRAAAKEHYPWTRLYEELKLVEPVYRKIEFGFDYRSYLQAYEKGEKLKYVNLGYKPSEALFSEARVGMRKNFKYNVESVFKNMETGADYSTRFSFVASDVELSRGEIEDIVRDRIQDIADDYECYIETTLTEAWHKEGTAWRK
jgi:predicted RNA-binding protein with EMAP domain